MEINNKLTDRYIHVKTLEEQYKVLLILNYLGYDWSSPLRYILNEGPFKFYKQDSVIVINYACLTYSDLDCARQSYPDNAEYILEDFLRDF